MHLAGIDLLLRAASFLGHIILLSVLLIRRRAKEFPVFTTLISANIVRSRFRYIQRNWITYWVVLLEFRFCSYVTCYCYEQMSCQTRRRALKRSITGESQESPIALVTAVQDRNGEAPAN